MHQHSEHPEFVKTIKDIRDAEEEYDRLLASAKEQSADIARKAKERSMEERAKADEGIVAMKNERLRKGGKDIESEVQKIVKKAQDDGAKISGKSLGQQKLDKLVKDFLGKL